MGPRLTPLVARWLEGAAPVDVVEALDEASVAAVRQRVREAGARAGLDATALESLAAAASELATNQLRHARRGRVVVRAVRRGQVPGVEVIAADEGPGIDDPAAALAGGAGSATGGQGGGLGAGLAAARRLSHELDLDVRLGEGTCARARAFAAPVPRSEVAILGRALAGEPVSGDDALARYTPDHLLVAVADGLGHGPEARAGAAAALDALAAADPTAPLPALIARCADAVRGTRGAVMSVARLDLATRAVEHAGVGDVHLLLHEPAGDVRLPGGRGFLAGASRLPLRVREDTASLGRWGALVLYSDGLKTAAAPPAGLVGDVVTAAHDLVARFARGTDDLTVLVAR